MPLGGWLISSVIEFKSNGVATMERIAAATNMAAIREAELTGKITAQEAAWLRLQRQAETTRARQAHMLTTLSAGVAVAGAVGIGYAIDQAANLERAMLNLQIATHASKSQMDAFRDSIYATASATAQSVPTIASLYGDIASTSGLPAASLTPEFLAKVTRFGEIVQMKSRGTTHEYSAAEAAKQLIELAHQYRAYTPTQIGTFAEMLHKATYFMPGGLSQFLTQSKYFTPLMALSAGNADAMQQSVLLGIMLQQTGLGRGRGGTGVAAFERQILQGLALTSSYTGGRKQALEAMGLIDPRTGRTPFVHQNQQGQEFFDVIGALGQVQKYIDQHTAGLTGAAKDRAEQDALRNAMSALGVQGSLVAMVAAGGGLQQIRNVQDRMKNIPSIDQDQAARLKIFWGEFQKTTSGMQTLFATLGHSILPEVTHGLSEFNIGLAATNKFLKDNEGVAKGIMGLLVVVTGSAATFAIAQVTLNFLKFIGLLGKSATAVGITGAAVRTLTGGISAMTGVSQAAAGGIGTLTLALKSALPILGQAASAVGVILGTTSFMTHDDARKNLIKTYGYDYWKYLKGRHPGTLPYSFDRGEGDMTPDQFNRSRHRQPLSRVVIQKQEIHLHGADTINALRHLADPRSPLYSSTRTHARIPLATSVAPR